MRMLTTLPSVFLVGLLLAGCQAGPEEDTSDSQDRMDLQQQVESRLQTLQANTTLFAKHLGSGREVAVRADAPVNTLSVIKIALMLQAFLDAEAGLIDMAERLTISETDKRRGAGILDTLDPGLQLTIRDLVTLMIITSDNTATDMLIGILGLERVNETLAKLGFGQTRILGTVGQRYRRRWELVDPAYGSLTDLEVYQRGSPGGPEARDRHFALNADPKEWMGQTTAREISRMLEQIHLARLASPASCSQMVEILKLQESESRLPRRLRFEAEGVVVAHKTGDSPPVVANDVGLIYYPNGPAVVSVFVNENRGDFLQVEETIGDIALKLIRAWQ